MRVISKYFLLGLLLVLSTSLHAQWRVGTTSDSTAAEEEDTIVHLTPEFIKTVQQYDQLGEYSERLAPVKRNGKWGFINVRGEEVISCQYDEVSIFHEGKAAVKMDNQWGYINSNNEMVIPLFKAVCAEPFSEGRAFILTSEFDSNTYATYIFIDENGQKVFGGRICDYTQQGYSIYPSFKNGLVDIEDEIEKVGSTFKRDGEKVEPSDSRNKTSHNFKYKISKDRSGYEVFFGLCNSSWEKLIPPKYHFIANEVTARFSTGLSYYDFGQAIESDAPYGVVLATFGSDDVDDYIYVKYYDIESPGKKYYGYVDLKGNDTFPQELASRCNEARRNAIKRIAK